MPKTKRSRTRYSESSQSKTMPLSRQQFIRALETELARSPCRHDYRAAKKVLRDLSEKTLAYYQERGGCCDCEIIFNCSTSH